MRRSAKRMTNRGRADSRRTPTEAAPRRRWPLRAAAAGFALVVIGLVLAQLVPSQAVRKPSTPAPATPPRPDIVFIVIDALRADRVGVYGGRPELSPTIDTLAREGVTFDRAISQAPWTQPAVASLFCAVHPSVHQVTSYEHAWNSTFADAAKVAVLSDTFTTLPEVLQQAGYQTAAFTANPFLMAEYGYAQGFDHFDASVARFEKTDATGAKLNALASRWLAARDPHKPAFLYLHYMEVHGPYDGDLDYLETRLDEVEQLPDKYVLSAAEMHDLLHLRRIPDGVKNRARHERLWGFREYWEARYDAGVKLMDRYIAELRDSLRALGIWDSAWIILTADHGEALCEHHFWDHGLSLHDNQLRVPLIWRWPGVWPAGRRVMPLVRLIDQFPTIAEQVGAAVPSGIQGLSILPLLQENARPETRLAFAESIRRGTEQKALYRDLRKVVFIESQPPRVAFFDLATDPHEQNDMSAQGGNVVRELVSLLKQQKEQNLALAPRGATESVPLSDAERRRLETLGYIGATRHESPTTQPADHGP